MKVAVIYYSFEGNTKSVAQKITAKYNADLYELKVLKNNVPESGFFKYFWGGKQVMMKQKPKIEDLNINITEYDVIFLGTPVWAFTFAPAIRTFFDKYKFVGKKVGIFCTHSGGPKDTLKDMEDYLTENEIVGELELIDPLKNTNDSNEKIDNWLNSLNI